MKIKIKRMFHYFIFHSYIHLLLQIWVPLWKMRRMVYVVVVEYLFPQVYDKHFVVAVGQLLCMVMVCWMDCKSVLSVGLVIS